MRRHDTGSATVEVAVLFPALLIVLFTGVQAAEWYHTRTLCLAAAERGVHAARTPTGSPAAGRAAAAAFLTRAAAGTVSDPRVSSDGSTATVVRIQVSAAAPTVLPIPGLTLRVSQSARAGKERFTT
jgi:Flp pilus assembly protein TadG